MTAMNVYICEDSPEGIFTGVYDAWAELVSRRREYRSDSYPSEDAQKQKEYKDKGHEGIRLVNFVENYELFCSYKPVETSGEKALKVIRTIYNRLGHQTYECLFRAICSNDPEKADAVYHTIAAGLSAKVGEGIMNHLSNPYVAKVFELDRKVGNETGHYIEFLRFKELQNGVLYAEIAPENRVVSMLAPHFCDRLVNENFVIHDCRRRESVVHEKQKSWVLVTGEEIDSDFKSRYSMTESFYQELFTDFCHTISIKERENIRLQKQMLPLKFQKYMTEFGSY